MDATKSSILRILEAQSKNINEVALTKKEKLRVLELVYLNYLCEDPIDGTSFDNDIMIAIQTLTDKYDPFKQEDTDKMLKDVFKPQVSNHPPEPPSRTYQIIVTKTNKDVLQISSFPNITEAEEAIEAIFNTREKHSFTATRLYKAPTK